MTTNQPAAQVKRKNSKSSSYRNDNKKNTQRDSLTNKGSSTLSKHSGKSKNKKKDLLPPPNGGIQRIASRPVYQKRDFPKAHITLKAIEAQCPICGKIIGNEKSALKFGDTAQPAHFNCVVQWLEKREQLEKNQYILYLGAGKFAVAVKQTSKQKNFTPTLVRTFTISDQASAMNPQQWERDLAITPECLVTLSRTTISP
ncbi:hypothetical protein PVA44_05805 [Entomospira nematocerorum]|uniref:Uncharacterized protein n=1 Tax=Entomospira nematocerorum TaxID=2719987 RepID=A0A968GCB6_9SPIO|nr:hypothetical protein [Entomospira nematocera]NIZ46467.1 hypothetical protein [Entomospira nematocera]WDI33731.1 hypothetical protein PVA44_05805 [Entomospira nematocera]